MTPPAPPVERCVESPDRVRVTLPVSVYMEAQMFDRAVVLVADKTTGELTARLTKWRASHA